MDVRRWSWSLARLLLPAVGFLLTCMGAYLLSLQTSYSRDWRLIAAYMVLLLGFLAMIIGVFWTLCHSMRSKMYQRRRGRDRHVQVYTIDRPTSFPPSYEESQGSHMFPAVGPETVLVVDGVAVTMSLAPPLYSRDSSEAPDCTWSLEQPPRYSQVERIQQGQVGAGERREALSTH